jgi:hypothetical protein
MGRTVAALHDAKRERLTTDFIRANPSAATIRSTIVLMFAKLLRAKMMYFSRR